MYLFTYSSPSIAVDLDVDCFFVTNYVTKKVSLSVADIRNHIHFIKKILHKWCGWLKTTLQIWSIKISLKKCPKNWKCLYLTITKYAVIKRYLITESAWSHVTKKHILLCCMIELRTYISDTNGISGLNYITNSTLRQCSDIKHHFLKCLIKLLWGK